MLLAGHNSAMVCSPRPNETFPDVEQANSKMARRMLPPHQSCSHQQPQGQGGLWAIPSPDAAHSSPDQNGTDRIRRQTSNNSDVGGDFRLTGMIDQPDFCVA